MMNARTMPCFTSTQWQELEQQALIYKHMVQGLPIPPDLLFHLKRSWDSSHLFPHQSLGWNYFNMSGGGLGRKIDPEPGRCRRTDGKKWRCSKEAFTDSKYCEKHMHRGRNRSRKPVEVTSTKPNIPSSFTTTTNNNHSFSLSSSMNNTTETTHPHPHHHHHHPYYTTSLPYPNSSSSSRSPGFAFPSQNNTTHFDFDSGSYSQAEKDYRCVHGVKEGLDERAFFSEASGGLRSNVPDLSLDNSWKSSPLRMTTSVSQNGYPPQSEFTHISNHHHHQQQQHCFVLGTDFNSPKPVQMEKQQPQEAKQPLRQFFDELPSLKNRGSWMKMEDERLNRNSYSTTTTTQLSISIPEPSLDFTVSYSSN